MEDKSFLGRGWSFPPEFRKGAYPTVMVKEEDDIRQSLSILMETTPGERVHRYDFGSGIKQFVFEQMSLTNQTLLRDTIENAVLLFEPRITLNEVRFNLSEAPEGVMYIEMDYTVRHTNRRSNMVFPFYLREGTDIAEL